MINIVNKLFGSIKSNSLKKYASFVEKVNKLEEETEKKWEGNFVWYLDNEEISFEASKGFEGENKLWRRLDY